MSVDLPRFCSILDPSLRSDLSLGELAKILADAGVHLVQLRAKNATSQALLHDACQLTARLSRRCRLIVNDRADVAVLARAAGVHLGQDDLPATLARTVLGSGKAIGLSTHNPEQVEAAQALPVDYVAIGPIFLTSTKPDTKPVVGLEGLRAVCSRTSKPVMAIGGITPANAAAVIEAGADSIAVIGAWLAVKDIPTRLEEFRSALGRLD
jgi:thiamine-phosphate pyrophosphorylase